MRSEELGINKVLRVAQDTGKVTEAGAGFGEGLKEKNAVTLF